MTKKKTPHVQIEPLEMKHAPFIQRYASDAAVAATTTLPHPYPENGGVEFVKYCQSRWEKGVSFTYAVMDGDDFVGACGVEIDKRGREGQPEIGYWIGKPFWGRGYGYAAARAVLTRVFSEQDWQYVIARSLTHNPASIRILEKCGFQSTGEEEEDSRGTTAFFIVKKEDYERIDQAEEKTDGGE